MRIRKRLFCPKPLNPLSMAIRNYSKPLAIFITTTLALVSLFMLSSSSVLPPPPAPESPLSPTEAWEFTAPNRTDNTVTTDWENPIVANGAVYLCNNEAYTIPEESYAPFLPVQPQHKLGTIYALDYSNGAHLWNFTANSRVSRLDVVNQIAYVCASANIYALNATTGAQKWVYSIDGYIIWSELHDQVIYVFFDDSGYDSYVCAINATSGAGLWRWNAGYYVWPSQLAFSDGAVYFGIDNTYYAVNITDGNTLWSTPINGGISESYTLIDSILYFKSSSNASYSIGNKLNAYLNALDIQTGEKLWSYPVGVNTSPLPIVENGVVYVNGREATVKNPRSFTLQLAWGASNVFAINASNGNKVWNYSANDMDFSALSVIGDVVYFSSSNGTLHALNATNGAQLWSNPLSDSQSFTIHNGAFYYHCDNTLFALDASNGNTLWTYTTASNMSFLTVLGSTMFFAANNTVYAIPTYPSS